MNRPAKPEPHDCAVMVRFTAEQYKALLKACGEEPPAVYVRRLALSGGGDPDPRVVEVTLRSRCGRWDGVAGVYTFSVAVEMIKTHERKGWTGELRLVDERPKVGPALPDVDAQVAAFNAAAEMRHAAIAAERLASNPLAKQRKP